MTRRKRAVAALVILQSILLGLGLVLLAFGVPIAAFVAVATAIGVLTLAIAFVWRRLAMQLAATREELDALAARIAQLQTAKAATPATPAVPVAPKAAGFLVGRAAGVRQAVETTYVEQEVQLFGSSTDWHSLSGTEATGGQIAVLGGGEYYSSLPAQSRIARELLPGVLEAQAQETKPGIVLCTSEVFTQAPWNQAIDASGTWLMQDLLRLRGWADSKGATLAFFDFGDMPIGVNTVAIRALFHNVIESTEPENVPEGAPVPAALAQLHRFYVLMTAARTAGGPR